MRLDLHRPPRLSSRSGDRLLGIVIPGEDWRDRLTIPQVRTLHLAPTRNPSQHHPPPIPHRALPPDNPSFTTSPNPLPTPQIPTQTCPTPPPHPNLPPNKPLPDTPLRTPHIPHLTNIHPTLHAHRSLPPRPRLQRRLPNIRNLILIPRKHSRTMRRPDEEARIQLLPSQRDRFGSRKSRGD